MDEMGLAEVVRALRLELQTAMYEGEDQVVQFDASTVELELSIGIKKATDGKAGIKFWVLDISGGKSYSAEAVQKIKLSLQPIIAGSNRLRISDGTDERPLSQGQ